MTNSDVNKAKITIRGDLTNPGQFFACCGLLEAASRLDEEAEGWFEHERFHVRTKPSSGGLIDYDKRMSPTQ
jgi:CRISPR-associated protein Csb3